MCEQSYLLTIGYGFWGAQGYVLGLGDICDMSDIFIELDTCVELILAKRESDAKKHIHTFDDDEPTIQVLLGRWGPYIKMEKKNYKIPKDIDAESLDREKCLYIIENQPKKKKLKAKVKTRAKKK